MMLTPKRGVLDITGYEGGRAEAPGTGRVFKLSSNESALGPSPKAMVAIRDAAVEAGVYPDASARLLRDTLAKLHGLDAERIVCGNGSDELLALIANCYLRPNDEVLMSLHGFLVYKIATLANSATPVEVSEPALKMDVDAVLARVTGRTRLVYIANPNNPTGSYLSAAELRRLHAGLPASVLLVIDAAYAEYVRRDDYESGMALASTADNVVMTRTFSKIFGLAGLRVGWAYCPLHVADTLNRVRGPFNVNVAAQRAAVAALGANGYAIPWNAFKSCRMSAKEINRSTQPAPGTSGPSKSDRDLMGAFGSPANALINDVTSRRSALGLFGSGGGQGSLAQFRTTSPHWDIVTSNGAE